MTSSSAKGSVHDNIIGALEARSARENVQESQKLEKLKALSAKKRPKTHMMILKPRPQENLKRTRPLTSLLFKWIGLHSWVHPPSMIFKGRAVGFRILTADRCFLPIVICLSAIS